MNPFWSRGSRNPDVPTTPRYIDDPTKGCFFQIIYTTISLLHFIEFSTSLGLIGYGIAISVYPDDPQRGFAAIINSWAVFMLTGSFLGILGMNKDFCTRIPLKISAYFGPVNALFNFVFLIILIVDKESVYHYFKQKHEPLHLSMEFINFFHRHIGFIYFILGFLIVFESLKVKIILSIRDDLLLYDDAKRNGMLREEAERSALARNEWQRDPTGESVQNELSTPLMSNIDEFQNAGNSSQWWEDDDNDHHNDNILHMEESMTSIEPESSGGSWMKRLSKRVLPSKQSESKSYQPLEMNQSDDDSDFKPVERDVEFQQTATEARNVNSDASDSNTTSTPPWFEDNTSAREDSDEKDLSWTREN